MGERRSVTHLHVNTKPNCTLFVCFAIIRYDIDTQVQMQKTAGLAVLYVYIHIIWTIIIYWIFSVAPVNHCTVVIPAIFKTAHPLFSLCSAPHSQDALGWADRLYLASLTQPFGWRGSAVSWQSFILLSEIKWLWFKKDLLQLESDCTDWVFFHFFGTSFCHLVHPVD